MLKQTLIAAACAVAWANPTAAQQPAAGPSAAAAPYAPYTWLIGDWSSSGGIRELITFGPNRAYLKFSVFTPQNGLEHLHFEGIAMWNGKAKQLDYLFAVEPGSGVQENGTIRAEADGSLVREVEFIDAKGATGTFRQLFKQTGPDTAVTSLFRQTDKGWIPTFPGAEKIELSRKAGTAASM